MLVSRGGRGLRGVVLGGAGVGLAAPFGSDVLDAAFADAADVGVLRAAAGFLAGAFDEPACVPAGFLVEDAAADVEVSPDAEEPADDVLRVRVRVRLAGLRAASDGTDSSGVLSGAAVTAQR